MAGRVHLTSLVAAVMAVSHVSALYLPLALGPVGFVPPFSPLFSRIPGAPLVDQLPRLQGASRPFYPQDAIPGALNGQLGAGGVLVGDPSGQASWGLDGGFDLGGGMLGGGMLGGGMVLDSFDPMDVNMVAGVGGGLNGNIMVGL